MYTSYTQACSFSCASHLTVTSVESLYSVVIVGHLEPNEKRDNQTYARPIQSQLLFHRIFTWNSSTELNKKQELKYIYSKVILKQL